MLAMEYRMPFRARITRKRGAVGKPAAPAAGWAVVAPSRGIASRAHRHS